MAENYDDDEIAVLYDGVLTRLNKGESLSDMDLDTLVEVYDYAYDLSDEFVTAEIMDNVLSRENDYQPMLERKAFRYALLSEHQGAKATAHKLLDSSFVKRLIMCQLEWDGDNWQESYRKLMAGVKPQSIDEYGAMCLIDFALSVDELGHLSRLLPLVLPLCEYPEDFLVDLSGSLLDNELLEEDVPVLLELTTLQPFSIDYWLQLAELYVNRLNNYEDGYSAIDYALAIDPDSGKALMLKGDLLMKVDGYANEVHEIADRLLDYPEFKDEALYLKAGAYIKEDKNKEALTYLERYTDVCNNPLDIFVLIQSISNGLLDGKLRNKLIGFIRAADIAQISAWISRARKVLDESTFEMLMGILTEADVIVSDEVFSLVILYLYRNGDYIKVRDLFQVRERTAEMNPFDTLVYIMSLLRLGVTEGMRELIKSKGEEIYDIVHNSGPEEKLLHVGSAKLIYDLNRYMDTSDGQKPNQSALDYLDPFVI